MAKAVHIVLGEKGESTAEKFLWAKGYKVLKRNWRFKRCEVDIIARKNNQLVFIEVKTRRNDCFGFPEEFVDLKKFTLMLEASEAYMEQEKLVDMEIRFDIIAITKNSREENLEHLEDVFFPDWM